MLIAECDIWIQVEPTVEVCSMKEEKRAKVRAQRVDTKCGSFGHMTVDEIKDRIVGDRVNVTCPECGEIHLTVEEAEEAEERKITASRRYAKIKNEAEGREDQ